MKKQLKNFVLTLGICMATFSVSAQQVNTLYFLENAPVRHYMNPSFQPLSGFYFGIPVLGYSQFGIGNNSITFNSLLSNKPTLFNSLRPTTLLRTDLQLNLLDFGFRHKSAYWTFSLTEKVDAQIGLPKDFFKLAMFGTEEIENNVFDMSSMNVNMNAYTEAALGYSKELNKKWNVGAKLKFLYGSANVSASFDQFELISGYEQWSLKANGNVRQSSPVKLNIGENFQPITTEFDPTNITNLTSPAGIGGAIDLGATFKPIEALTIAAAVTDLGLIRWSKNTSTISAGVDYTFGGAMLDGESLLGGNVNMQTLTDSILNSLDQAQASSVTSSAY